MTTTPTENDPLLQLVKKLDPLHGQPAATSADYKQEIFAQVMGDEAHVEASAHGASTVVSLGKTPRRRFALPGVIAASVVVVVAALLFGLFRAPSAEAVLIEAAERTALIDSGQVNLVVSLRAPVELAGAELKLRYLFDGNDYSLQLIGPNPAGTDIVVMTDLSVDGVGYIGDSFGGGPTVWSVNDNPGSFQSDFLPGLSAASAGPETVLPLVRLADDYQVTQIDDGSLYRGTISREDLLARPALPAGVAIVASGSDPASDLPETLVLEVLVANDLIQQLVLLVEGEVPSEGEFFSATVTTTYSQHGEPQNLVAPVVLGPSGAPVVGPDGEIDTVDLPPEAVALPYWVPGPEPQTENELVIAEMLQRRPKLCFDAGFPTSAFESPGTTNVDARVAVITCLLDNGEPAAAEAVNAIPVDLTPAAIALGPGSELPPWAPGPNPQTAEQRVIAEVLQRRPGLCFEAGTSPTPESGGYVTVLEIQDAVLQCFIAEEEPAAAEAARTMFAEFVEQIPAPSWAPGLDPQTPDEAIIAEVLQRRPGLCFDAGWPKNPQPGQRVTNEEIQAGVVDCFANKGEGEAALAASRLPGFDDL